MELIERAQVFDGVVVQRRLLPIGMAKKLRQAAQRLAFDFDDAVVFKHTRGGQAAFSLRRLWAFKALISRCDAITSGNDYLASLARRYCLSERVSVVPTVVPQEKYSISHTQYPLPTPQKGPLAIGWIGQSSTRLYLERLAPALKALQAKFPNMILRVISDAAPKIDGVKVELVPWSDATEVRDLRTLTVGLAPLSDDRWTRGKCGLRLIQYLAAGVAAVASPVGVQWGIVEAGGALGARDGRDWVAAVSLLLEDEALRRQMADAGPRLVGSGYVAGAWIDTILAAWCGK